MFLVAKGMTESDSVCCSLSLTSCSGLSTPGRQKEIPIRKCKEQLVLVACLLILGTVPFITMKAIAYLMNETKQTNKQTSCSFICFKYYISTSMFLSGTLPSLMHCTYEKAGNKQKGRYP